MSNKRVAVCGAGAMGGILGAGLAQGGVDVVLVDTWKEHVEAMTKNGLRIESEGGVETVAVRTTTELASIDPVDLLIVLVKAPFTEDVMRTAGPILAPGAAVASLQNGIGNEEIIAAAVGPERTLAGSLYFGGSVKSPGVVHCSARDAGLAIGAFDPAGRALAETAHGVMKEGGFNAKLYDDILGIKWQKGMLNVGISAITAILNLPVRVSAEQPGVRQAMIASCEEGLEVARQKGISLGDERSAADYISSGVDIHDYVHKASMCLDIEAGRATEIEFINGAIARYGQELGVATPLNTIIAAAVRRLEQEKG
jgi:2-dehydropantoate 2-reductase